jgi:menaquinone-dependent protoporphyrinogen oxidase
MAPNLQPPTVMARVLIVYATREGQTEKIARRMAETLNGHAHTAELFNPDHDTNAPALEQFQVVIVGGPIHAGGYPRSIVRFVQRHRTRLERMPSAFFSVGLAVASRTSDGRGPTLEIVERFVEQTGWRPSRVELIAGALPYSKYNFLIRFVMQRISAKEGGDTDTARDYEYTDWDAVDRFALDIVPKRTATDSTGAGREPSAAPA